MFSGSEFLLACAGPGPSLCVESALHARVFVKNSPVQKAALLTIVEFHHNCEC